jgi:hypothetical protein
MIYKELGGVEACGGVVIFSRTARPGSVVAARRLGLKVFFLAEAPVHHLRHGKKTMESMFTQLRLPQAKQQIGFKKRAPTMNDLSCIEVSAANLGEQIVKVADVALQAECGWRAGRDMHIHDLATKSAKQLEAELNLYSLEIVSTDKGRALRAGKALYEGDLVMYAAGPSFSSLQGVAKILGEEGNTAFMDKVLMANFAEGPVYRVLTGAAGYLQHYLGIRRGGPNVEVVACTAAGLNDGLFEVRVKTRTDMNV